VSEPDITPDEAVEPEVDAPETGADDALETPTETQERLYAGKYTSPDELEKGYGEASAAMTRAQQEAAELREQIAEYEAAQNAPDPFNPLANYGLDDDDWKNVARSVETNPEETLKWAMSDEIARAYPDMKQAVTRYWTSIDPWSASQHAAKEAFAEEAARIENLQAQWDQRTATEKQERQAAAVVAASDEIHHFPDFEKHRHRIAELIAANAAHDDDPRFADPKLMVDYAKTMYARAVLEEHERQIAAQAAGDEPTPAAKGAKARTATRSTASAAAQTGDPVMQAYLDAMSAAS
jgi:hypothetical protein